MATAAQELLLKLGVVCSSPVPGLGKVAVGECRERERRKQLQELLPMDHSKSTRGRPDSEEDTSAP